MFKQETFKNNYDIWKSIVDQHVYKIIRIKSDAITIDLKRLFKKNYHPYTAAILAILQTEQYKTNNIYSSFVIPYNSKIVIVDLD